MTTTYEIEEISLYAITPPHGVNDREKLNSLVTEMQESGWVGRPLLVIETQGAYQSLTGSHRIAAAERVGIEEVPCVVIDPGKLHEYGYDSNSFQDDDVVLSVLSEIFGDDADCVRLMREEVASNNA